VAFDKHDAFFLFFTLLENLLATFEKEIPVRFLITGANGFVGRPLVTELLRQGHAVQAAVRSTNSRIENLEVVSVGSIDGATDWVDALGSVDVVIHLAARVHMMKDAAVNPLEAFLAVNLHGTANLARQAATAGVKRFVYASSIKVNGEQTSAGQPFAESDHPQPQDPYAISKWQAEQALQGVSQETGIEVAIVRPPLVYGPRVKANFLKLFELVDRGVPLPLGSVQNSRSLIYVGNLVDALITCATHPMAAGHTYLVSDGEDVSTPQLIRAVADALHRPSRVFPLSIALMRGAAKLIGKSAAIDRLTQSLMIDSSKIRNELGWAPSYTMALGLQATAEWYHQSVKPGRT
jgi:nucleoside-diphosphate-sugar epimerase